MPIGSVEIGLTYGGDFAVLPNGDLQLVSDVPGAPLATLQRVTRLILTNARIVDPTTGTPSTPDDVFNVNWGSNARNSVGAMVDDNLVATIQAQIINALASDADIANVPAPIVTVVQAVPASLYVTVTCYAITGELISIPSLPLTAGT